MVLHPEGFKTPPTITSQTSPAQWQPTTLMDLSNFIFAVDVMVGIK
jgi:hypothetical protein